MLAAERAADPFGHDRLAVAGRAVEEERLRRVDRRPELVEHRLVDDELIEARRQARRDRPTAAPPSHARTCASYWASATGAGPT